MYIKDEFMVSLKSADIVVYINSVSSHMIAIQKFDSS
jgi:hypothetical protein